MKKPNWKRRTMVTLLAIVLCCGISYWAMGCPAFTVEQAFRRAEEKRMLGPATILGTETIDCPGYGYDYDTLIIAQTEYGSMLYSTKLNEMEYLYYRPNSSSFTIMALPNGGLAWPKDEPRQLNVILFDNNPKAVSAELELIIDFDAYLPEGVYYHYKLTAQRENRGYFRFVHTIFGSDYMDNDNAAMKMLTEITCSESLTEFYHLQYTIPATVRLYDEDHNLIAEESLTIRSIGAEERDKIGK